MYEASRVYTFLLHSTRMNRALWRRLPTLHGSAVDALVGVEALLAGLKTTGQPAMRWYVVKQPALILGSSQRLSEIDIDACRSVGVTVHKRRSGGSTVYTDEGALSLDVALPAGHPLLPAHVTATYRWFGEVWAAALGSLGVDARVLDPEESRPLNASLDPMVQRACYGGVSPYEVCVGERKIVGLAQVRRQHGAVLQAGVYMRWEPERLVPLLAIPAEERARALSLLRERAVGLHDVVGSAPSHANVVAAWERVLRSQELGVLSDAAWMDDELLASQQTRERYANLLDISSEP
jgi:lipoate---protein ligase